MDDMKFLRDWVERGSEDSFRTLVDRHLNMVYCAARRLVPSSHQAEEVTQTVFCHPRQKSVWSFQANRVGRLVVSNHTLCCGSDDPNGMSATTPRKKSHFPGS